MSHHQSAAIVRVVVVHATTHTRASGAGAAAADVCPLPAGTLNDRTRRAGAREARGRTTVVGAKNCPCQIGKFRTTLVTRAIYRGSNRSSSDNLCIYLIFGRHGGNASKNPRLPITLWCRRLANSAQRRQSTRRGDTNRPACPQVTQQRVSAGTRAARRVGVPETLRVLPPRRRTARADSRSGACGTGLAAGAVVGSDARLARARPPQTQLSGPRRQPLATSFGTRRGCTVHWCLLASTCLFIDVAPDSQAVRRGERATVGSAASDRRQPELFWCPLPVARHHSRATDPTRAQCPSCCPTVQC